MSNPARYLSRFLCAAARARLGRRAHFVVDPLNCSGPRECLRRCIRRQRVQDAGLVRSQQFDTAFMGTSLAVHYRQSDIDGRSASAR